MYRIIKAATLEDMIDAFENRIDQLDASACDKITSTTWIDVDGAFGEKGAKYTDQEIREYWDEDHDDDPTMMEYSSFEDWWEDTKEWMKEDVDSTQKICAMYEIDPEGHEEIVGWLADHKQAYDDACNYFHTDDLMTVKAEDIEAWICEHDQLCKDYCRYFGLDCDDIVNGCGGY